MDAFAAEPPIAHHRAPLSDDVFLVAFEAAAIPLPQWDHLSHLRAARLLIAQMPLAAAIDEIRTRIRRLNQNNRVPETETSGYHETVTIAFMHLVADAYVRDPGITSLDFCIRHAELSDSRVILRHYSRELLWSAAARARFLPPDRQGLPGSLRQAS